VSETTSVTRSAVDRAAMTADSLRPIAVGVAMMFGGLTFVHLALLPGRPGLVMAGAALLTSVVMLILWGLLHTELGPVLERHAQAVGAGVGAFTAANTLLHVVMVGDPWPTCAVMLVIVGVGGCVSSRLWSGAVIAATNVAWVVIAFRMGDSPLWGHFAMQMGCATILGVVLNVVRHRTVARLEEAQRAVAAMAVTDELTGLANRRGLLLTGDPLLEAARRGERSMTVLYLDVDGLKQVNDEQGHTAGDRLIADTGEVLRGVFRSADVVARLGGDEFAILLTGAGETEVAILQERLRARLAEAGIAASLGVHQDNGQQSLEQLLDMADLAMYAAKRERRANPRRDVRAVLA
jgi:diguanylate cyclase (GGDEF)-like protein